MAVAYADSTSADAPDPSEVVALGARLGCRAALLDTFDKRRGPLLQQVDQAFVERFLRAAREAGLVSVVAGGLGPRQITRVLPLAPDYVGVRGAACRRGRRAGTRC